MAVAGLIARNTLANWSRIAVNLVVLLLLTPFVERSLGDERFGVYLIGQQALLYINLLTLGMRAAATRFVGRSIAAGDNEDLNRTLTTMGAFYVAAGVVGAVLCAGFGVVAPSFFAVRPAYEGETRLLFAALAISFLLSLLEFVYRSILIGHYRYDLLNAGDILRDVGKALLIFLLFQLGMNSLTGMGLAIVLAFGATFFYFLLAGHRQQPGLQLRVRHASRRVAGEIIGFGAWNGMVQIGNVVTSATPPMIVGRILGPEAVGIYVIPFTLAERLRVIVVGLANTLSPLAAATLATGDRARFRALIIKGTRAAATLALPLGAILMVLCEPFLVLWMGADYAAAGTVFVLLMLGMFGRISQAPTLYVLLGGGQIRGLALIQLGAAVAILSLTTGLMIWTELGVLGAALGVAIPLIVSHTVLLPWYAARQMSVPLLQYYRESYTGPVLSGTAGTGIALLLSWWWPVTDWPELVIEGALAAGVAALVAWYTCFEASLRARIGNRIRSLIGRSAGKR